MSNIPKAVLEALEKWRSDHKAAQDVVIEVMEGKRTGGALHYTARANESILELSRLIEDHKIRLADIFLDQEELDRYERYLYVGKFYGRRVLKMN